MTSTKVTPTAREPLKTGDEYIVKVGGLMKIVCRVLEASSGKEMVFDSTGTTSCGLIQARFRFTVWE
jgi:hypothetical protein